jgi:hypothetical protein
VLAKDFVDNFNHVYSEMDRVIRVKENDVFAETIMNLSVGAQVFNDVRNPSLYVELDEGESNITQKEESFNRMVALANLIGSINPQLVDIRTLVESAPISGSEKFVEYIDQTIQMQAEAAQRQSDLDTTKQTLDNIKTERGMVTDEEKLRLEAQKIGQGVAKQGAE